MYVITNGEKFWTCTSRTDVGRIIGCSFDTVRRREDLAYEDGKTVFRFKNFLVGIEHEHIKTKRGFALKKRKGNGFH